MRMIHFRDMGVMVDGDTITQVNMDTIRTVDLPYDEQHDRVYWLRRLLAKLGVGKVVWLPTVTQEPCIRLRLKDQRPTLTLQFWSKKPKPTDITGWEAIEINTYAAYGELHALLKGSVVEGVAKKEA